MSTKTTKVAIRMIIYNYIGKISCSIFFVLTFILITKKLDIAEYGKYSFFLNAVFFITILLDFGLPEVILRYIPEYIEKKQFGIIKGLIQKSIYLVMRVSGGLLLLSVIFIFFSKYLFPSKFTNLVYFLPALIVFGCVRIMLLVYMDILNSFYFLKFKIITEIFISFLRFSLVYFCLLRSFDARYLIIIFGFLDILTVLIFFTRLNSVFRAYPIHCEERAFERMRRYGINEYFFKLFWFFTDNRFDLYLAGFLLGFTQAGYFGFAASCVNFLADWSPAFIIRPVVSPFFVKEYMLKNTSEHIQKIFAFHTKTLIFVTLPLFILAGLLINEIIINVFDPKYLPSRGVFIIFIFTLFFINILIPLRNIIALIEKPQISNFTNLIAIPKIVFILIFGKLFGIVGVACVFSISFFSIIALSIILIKKEIVLFFPWKTFGKIFINAVVMSVFVLLFKRFVDSNIKIFLISLVALAVYMLASYINKIFSVQEREIFNAAFGAKIWKF